MIRARKIAFAQKKPNQPNQGLIMTKKYVVYFNIETVRQPYEDMETLPVITVVDDGREKIISGGIEVVTGAILEIVPYLGSDHCELIPLAVEVWDVQESKLLTARRPRKRQRKLA